MFSGIVQAQGKVLRAEARAGFTRYGIAMPLGLCPGLVMGASVAVDGVCLSLVGLSQNSGEASFDVIGETLSRTSLGERGPGAVVNLERSLRFGDEIGGHICSGHIWGIARISEILVHGENKILWLHCPRDWLRYILPKGFIALNGASLTVVDVDQAGRFSVHLIPETLRVTTFGRACVGDAVNLEIDAQTQAIVSTVESLLPRLVQEPRGEGG